MRILAPILIFCVLGCTPQEFEEVPTPEQFSEAPSLNGTISFYTAPDCAYCILAKEDKVTEVLEQKFDIAVTTHYVTNEEVPYLLVNDTKLPVYYDGYLFSDDPDATEKRMVYLCGKVALALKEEK